MRKLVIAVLVMLGIAGCSNSPRMGQSVAYLKTEQVYNPNATQENMGLVPEGSGERAQTAIEGYNKGASENIAIGSGFSN
ncbi:hypothetical protein JCM19232_23 [Vibrio ishigakensis]|uniref:Lipoprotein n=1 Tax=Vibrio ishigakensis TaxID=1481914 RepID=A0A0B8PQN5_9VIBR|nr:hypothetical protein JCM19232_23 [Vibrio ishigakensis]